MKLFVPTCSPESGNGDRIAFSSFVIFSYEPNAVKYFRKNYFFLKIISSKQTEHKIIPDFLPIARTILSQLCLILPILVILALIFSVKIFQCH
jgi:hypothetical protein